MKIKNGVINKNNYLRKNISINSDDFYVLSSFAKKVGISFSELVRKAALKYVEEQEKLDLSDFLRANLLKFWKLLIWKSRERS